MPAPTAPSPLSPSPSPLGLLLRRERLGDPLAQGPRAKAIELLQGLARVVIARELQKQTSTLRSILNWPSYRATVRALDAQYDRPETTDPLHEMLLLSIAMQNPALAAERPLFDTRALAERSPYEGLLEALELPLHALLQTLRAPVLASPNDLQGQIEHLLRREAPNEAAFQETHRAWDAERTTLLRARDHLREAHALRDGPAPMMQRPRYSPSPLQPNYSRDSSWMPEVVLIAKQTYVWLDQLSRKYQRSIERLDQIPDAELDQLKGAGFTALWLIGLWERSEASARIKQRAGQEDAIASAYALHDYRLAEDLGGEDAYQNLKSRAASRGIRLAADMVPNHMGLDSRWVLEHPQWFVQSARPPFEGYRFTGPNLSDSEQISVQLEDGYDDQSDAAVVFQRTDLRTGENRYIYHGNDGTQMPWNDTAQLDYLNPEVREAVIQTIIGIAKRFSLIRFDAAMTLATRHIRRLWHPQPGEGGAIPSRAEAAVSLEDFEAALPQEFWREVVERVKREAPDTLLLAEAFWMMEGYFVRELGMHRVYNSAFMHMLKDERTGEYRQMLKELLQTAPQVLERFVNFMNNPDEDSAIDQFGDSDKYFGVATLMVTMPGLPMFGHGQIEGFQEKYGMEYRQARTQEHPNERLIARHRRELFPLMRRRALFSSAKNFALYDLSTQHDTINENVMAYSNFCNEQRALVIYNNSYERTQGWIGAVSKRLCKQLNLPSNPQTFVGLREQREGLWYLHSTDALAQRGLRVELDGYRCMVFLDFRVLHDARWSALEASLQGRGVPDLDAALESLEAHQASLGLLEFSTESKKNEAFIEQPCPREPQPQRRRRPTPTT